MLILVFRCHLYHNKKEKWDIHASLCATVSQTCYVFFRFLPFILNYIRIVTLDKYIIFLKKFWPKVFSRIQDFSEGDKMDADRYNKTFVCARI